MNEDFEKNTTTESEPAAAPAPEPRPAYSPEIPEKKKNFLQKLRDKALKAQNKNA